jgi:pimeloyl-ACP methyl ester carboxylesterase
MRWVIGVFVTLVLLLIVGGVGIWLVLRAPDLPQAELEARYVGTASRFVELPGRIRLHYKDEGKGPVLVLVHGGGDNLWTWDGWVEVLKSHYRIIRVDLPGHGLTQVPPGTKLNLTGSADLIATLTNKLGVPKFAVAGNSLGGLVALNLAVHHPEKLSALILVDSAGLPNPPSSKKPPLAFQLLQYSWARAILKTIDNKPLINDSLKNEVGNPAVITEAIVNRWADVQRAPGHRDILLGGSWEAKPLNEETLHKIAVPTLVLWGAVDPVVAVSSGKKFAAIIPGARLVIYPHVGHLPQIEVPAASAHDVAAFLGTIPN